MGLCIGGRIIGTPEGLMPGRITTALLALTIMLATAYDAQAPGTTVPVVTEAVPFKIKVEFVIYAADAVIYPHMIPAFTKALQSWSELIPIDVNVFVQPDGFLPVFLGLGNPSAYPHIIHVRFSDFSLDKWRNSGYVGVWVPFERTIYLDGKWLEGKPERALRVCLHELGHAFGVGHVVTEKSTMGVTGDIAISAEAMPQRYIMFPGGNQDENKYLLPSQIEVDLATEYILHCMHHEAFGGYVGECGYTPYEER